MTSLRVLQGNSSEDTSWHRNVDNVQMFPPTGFACLFSPSILSICRLCRLVLSIKLCMLVLSIYSFNLQALYTCSFHHALHACSFLAYSFHPQALHFCFPSTGFAHLFFPSTGFACLFFPRLFLPSPDFVRLLFPSTGFAR